MVKSTYEISDELDVRFRQAVATRKGFRKGALGEAISEAIDVWLDPEAAQLVEKYRTKTKAEKTGNTKKRGK